MTPEDFKLWRKELGLSQQAAADALGLSKSSVELYERGSRRDDGRAVEIPRTVALACSAIYHRLGEWNYTLNSTYNEGIGMRINEMTDEQFLAYMKRATGTPTGAESQRLAEIEKERRLDAIYQTIKK